ncbi:MAG TPA: SH3 domain-containing protein [Thermomicrobiales bacterium]|nr:SH3 domain-containing protein [Thermomicrobiales bacterium]
MDSRVFTRRGLVLASVGITALTLTRGPAGATAESMYAVARPGLRLRSGPGLDYGVLASLEMGATVQYLDSGGRADGYDWARVKVVRSGQIGYVAYSLLAPIPSDGFSVGMMVHVSSASGGNLRSGPGTGYGVLRVVGKGTTGTVTGGPAEANGYFWYKLSFGNTTGWMATTVFRPGPGSDRAFIQVTRGPLNVRSQPGLGGEVLARVQTGATGFATTDMPREADGYTWLNVQFEGGLRGWVARSFVAWI